ncbi:hypothetical protein KEJ21_06950 [Candidatus Bathyarchaeota archaeon]|nr:hypothetical protein [Candidatus Bathyarchaeota archaeon]MBS7631103.1 hypothetical protein [Candidatus Bathyarchaeota archaeon]
MSKEKELLKIVEKTLPFPTKVIVGYAKLDTSFTSGDLARICNIPSSSAKFYLNKMIELRMVTKIPHKKRYQKFSNAETVSSWLKDLIKVGLLPLETGSLTIPEKE